MKRKKVVTDREGVAYRYSYFVTFVVAFVVYFGRRYVPAAVIPVGHWVSMGMSLGMAVWNMRRKGLSYLALLGLAAALGFFWLLPSTLFYGAVALPLISFFLLGPAVDTTDKDFIQGLFYVKLFLGLVIGLAYVWGYLPDVTGYNYQKELTLHSYGFMHPNSLSMYFTSVLMDYYLMKKKEVSFIEWVTTATICLLVFMSTDSRLGVVISLVVLAVAAGKSQLEAVTVPSWLVLLGLASCFVFGTLLSHFYQEGVPFFDYMNSLFTNRPGNANTYIKEYGYRLWPYDVPGLYFESGRMRHNENFYVDSLLRFGAVLYSFFPIMLVAQLWRKKFSLYVSCFIWLAFATAMIEDYGVNLLMCSALLFEYWALPSKEQVLA